MILKVAAIDPSLTGFGMAKFTLDTDTLAMSVPELKRVSTEKEKHKQVRRNSDDLRRAQELVQAFYHWVDDCVVVFSEIPSGAQSARAAFSFGIMLGIVAGSPVPVIQVMPSETKMAAVGTKTASKEEMVDWATTRFPGAAWLTRKVKGKIEFLNANDDLADAVAVGFAGVKTDQFQQLIAMYRGSKAA